MTTPRDADQHPDTPVVHLTRRAALQAERAAATAPVVPEQPQAAPAPAKAPRAAAPAKALKPVKAARATKAPKAARAPKAVTPTTPAARTRSTEAASIPAATRTRRTSRLTVVSAVAAVVLFASAAMPAHASANTSMATSTIAPTVRTQDYAVTQAVASASTSRDGFTVNEAKQVVVAAPSGTGAVTAGAVNSGAEVTDGGAVRSPFPGPVRMSSGFGWRSAPCGACSSLHQGLDFNPGMGAPIGSVAAGTVRVSGIYFSYGQTVIVDHVVDGRKVSTLYGHMIPGSSPVRVGDRVDAGQFLGSVGSSGVSTGAHLHLEVLMDGTLPVDPRAWIESHTGRAL
ncbi:MULTISPECIES: M23 family metallopeptidase [unclassified Curtobacterium]|uniref:M23 family metallopeptidase n=1 Tax=unclassified Curtobacterium TaxID=257496 RepID=UPI00226BA94E|nr:MULTISPECIES: M23 family metallopeptidase [unclassified Curtobacterium]